MKTELCYHRLRLRKTNRANNSKYNNVWPEGCRNNTTKPVTKLPPHNTSIQLRRTTATQNNANTNTYKKTYKPKQKRTARKAQLTMITITIATSNTFDVTIGKTIRRAKFSGGMQQHDFCVCVRVLYVCAVLCVCVLCCACACCVCMCMCVCSMCTVCVLCIVLCIAPLQEGWKDLLRRLLSKNHSTFKIWIPNTRACV